MSAPAAKILDPPVTTTAPGGVAARSVATSNSSVDSPVGGKIAPENEGVGIPLTAKSSLNVSLHSINVTDQPTVRIRVGPPISGLRGKSLKADTPRIMRAIVNQLPPEARRRRTPTPEELALTYPPGYRGASTAESDRRPGTD